MERRKEERDKIEAMTTGIISQMDDSYLGPDVKSKKIVSKFFPLHMLENN